MRKRQPVVAVVDDDLGMRKSFDALLTAFGYRVELYKNAEEFFAAKPAEKPACLVLDVFLSDITGIELSRQMLAAGIKVPTVFVSASKDQMSRRQAVELGCVAFLEKPFAPRLLIEAVATATGPDPFFER